MMTRFVSSAPPGLAITLGLLWVMQSLLGNGAPIDISAGIRLPKVFLVDRQDPPPPDREVQPPERIVPPPVVPTTRTTVGHDEVMESPYIDHGPGRPSAGGGDWRIATGHPGYSDGPLISVIKVAPEYPPAATARGLEGFVTVQFDVSAEGAVENVIVLESSSAVFERAAVRAAYRFRFKARVVDGTPVASRGVQNRFRFSLTED
jgi:protein TonB